MVYSKLFTIINGKFSDYTMLYFHSWEFSSEIVKFEIPNYIKKNPNEFLGKLEKYILFCKKRGYEFDTVENYLQKLKL